jgi:hypothetical protein
MPPVSSVVELVVSPDPPLQASGINKNKLKGMSVLRFIVGDLLDP